MTNEIILGPLVRNAACLSAGTPGPTTLARYWAALAGVSGTPALRITSLFGIQMPAPERAAEPPNLAAFSTTRTVIPRLAAVSAATIPAAPDPTTTTSYSGASVGSAWAATLPRMWEPRKSPAPVAAAPRSTFLREGWSIISGMANPSHESD